MSSLFTHARPQSLSALSLADGQVNDILLQIMPDFNEASEALRQLVDANRKLYKK